MTPLKLITTTLLVVGISFSSADVFAQLTSADIIRQNKNNSSLYRRTISSITTSDKSSRLVDGVDSSFLRKRLSSVHAGPTTLNKGRTSGFNGFSKSSATKPFSPTKGYSSSVGSLGRYSSATGFSSTKGFSPKQRFVPSPGYTSSQRLNSGLSHSGLGSAGNFHNPYALPSSFSPRQSATFGTFGGGAAPKPFSSYTSRPAVSPYMNLFRVDPTGGENLNYQTLVRPQLQQLKTNQQQTLQNQALTRQLRSLQSQQLTPTRPGAIGSSRFKTPGTFNNRGHYFPK